MTDKEALLRYRIKQAEETLADAEAMRKPVDPVNPVGPRLFFIAQRSAISAAKQIYNLMAVTSVFPSGSL
jgi:hypothetical protein